jgi:CubicO group peptidase (beta-lactamase class C family)
MVDTGFSVPADRLDRFASYYRTGPAGHLELADRPDGQWSTLPPFPLGSGGLVGTADDWFAFARMLLAGGRTVDGRRLLSADSVQLMINNHTTHAQRMIGELFLEGQGWGFGGSVDIETIDAWNVLGRYGWVGGTGTSAHITPSTGTVAILLTQVAADGPTAPEWMRAFWRYVASRG